MTCARANMGTRKYRYEQISIRTIRKSFNGKSGLAVQCEISITRGELSSNAVWWQGSRLTMITRGELSSDAVWWQGSRLQRENSLCCGKIVKALLWEKRLSFNAAKILVSRGKATLYRDQRENSFGIRLEGSWLRHQTNPLGLSENSC
jgi:hypothetical protein